MRREGPGYALPPLPVSDQRRSLAFGDWRSAPPCPIPFALARVDASLECQAHFFVVPRTQAVRAKANEARIALAKRLFNRRLPRIAGDQIPFVQPAD
jgi:hypothetical protein